MSQTALKEFDRYRFVREDDGGLASLPSVTHEGRSFMVVDCDSYQLARLHIFEGKASDVQRLTWFEREMETISRLNHPLLNRVLSWGKDDSELFYVDSMIDGETIAGYLGRNGPLSEAQATRVTRDLVSVLRCGRAIPRTLENFSADNLFFSNHQQWGIQLEFCDFSGWAKPCVLLESELVQRVCCFFASLINLDFDIGSPEAAFEGSAFSSDQKEALTEALAGETHSKLVSFDNLLQEIEDSLGEPKPAQRPQSFLRKWLLKGENNLELSSEYDHAVPSMNGHWTPELAFAFDAAMQGPISFAPVRFQVFPGHETIPRNAWFEQHRAALRRPGRGFPNQLIVQSLEPRGQTLLIGEERIEGLNLLSIVRHIGPLKPAHALEMARKLSAALDAIEKSANSTAICWLPPENIYVVTGSEEPDSLKDAIDHFGARTWQRLPMRLRLHQTAGSLLEGVSLPPELVSKIDRVSKTTEQARRTAVLMPAIWYSLTGDRFSWENEVAPVDERVSKDIAEIFETNRALLLSDPESIHMPFVEQFHETLKSGSEAEDFADGEVFAAGPMIVDEGVSQVMPAIIQDGAVAKDESTIAVSEDSPPTSKSDASPSSSKPGKRSLFSFGSLAGAAAAKINPKSDSDSKPDADEESDTEPESLGTIIDDSLAFSQEHSEEEEKHDSTSSFDDTPIADDSLAGSESEETEPEIDSEVVSETIAEETEIEEAEEEPPETQELESSATEPLGTVEGDSFDEEPDAELIDESPEPESANTDDTNEEEEKEEDSDITDEEEAAVESEVVDDEKDIEVIAPSPELSALPHLSAVDAPIKMFDHEAKTGTASGDAPKEESVSNPNSIFSTLAANEHNLPEEPDDSPGFGESLLAKTKAESDSNKDKKESGLGWLKVAGLAIIAAIVFAGAAHMINRLSGWFQKQDLTERFPVTDYNPQLFKVDPIASRKIKAPENPVDLPTEGITTLADAMKQGKAAVETGDLGKATTLFLHALKLQPASAEAKTQLWKTLQDWRKSDAPLSKSNANKLENASEFTPQSSWLLAEYYMPRDPAQGLHWLTLSADSGHAPDMRKLGLILAQGKLALANPEKAIDWLTRAAEREDADAQFYLGECYILGNLIEKDQLRGTEFLERSADQGHPAAMELLGINQLSGEADESTAAKGFNLISQSARLDHPGAIHQLALCHVHANGTVKNEPAAAESFQRAAMLGHAKSMYAYGLCLNKGFGTERSSEKAANWLRKAAELGNEDAIAWCRSNGVVLESPADSAE